MAWGFFTGYSIGWVLEGRQRNAGADIVPPEKIYPVCRGVKATVKTAAASFTTSM
jgi:hypothetical protein